MYYVCRFFSHYFLSEAKSICDIDWLPAHLVSLSIDCVIKHLHCSPEFSWRYVLQCMYARCVAVVFIQDGCCEGPVMHPGHSPVSCLSAAYFLLSEFHFESALFCFFSFLFLSREYFSKKWFVSGHECYLVNVIEKNKVREKLSGIGGQRETLASGTILPQVILREKGIVQINGLQCISSVVQKFMEVATATGYIQGKSTVGL